MCGFIGMYKKSGDITEAEQHTVSSMLKLIAHRGPDQQACAVVSNACFGFCRLSIIAISTGDQPFDDGRCIGVFNGEIYNYLELRGQLEKDGEEFKTPTEIEVILRMYEIYGPSFITRLRGMFALYIYDKQTKEAFVARDAFGIKPLYYRDAGDKYIFASEMKAFAADESLGGFDVDKEMLQHYMTFQYVTEPNTITEKINVLPAGHYMTLSGNSMKILSWYQPSFAPKRSLKYTEKQKALRDAVENSVRHHLISEAPIGAFLSSGVDSAIVTTLASRYHPGIKAFTVGFDVKGYSEFDDASRITEKLDVEHIKLHCTLDDFTENFEKVIWHLDSPVADPSVIAIYLVSREASKYVKSVLAGEGSDELFGGYRIYDTSRSSAFLSSMPGFIRAALLKIASSMPDGKKGKNYIIRSCTPIEKRYVGNSFVFSEKDKEKLLKTYDPSVSFTDRTAQIFDRVKGSSALTKMQYCDMFTWLRSDILVKGDRLSMANSLEIRVPFLDKEVFKAASVLCDKDKLNKGTTKYILRDTFSDILDEDTVKRPKLGYPVPVRVWLKDELYDWAKNIIKNNAAEEFIDSSEALKLLDMHREGKADLYHQIWTILTFITWYRLYVNEDYKRLSK